jgi:hypothetical protein
VLPSRPIGREQTDSDTHQALLGGGTDGNEVLTSLTGVVLLILLAVIGVTILRIGQLLWLHLFIGLLLVGPIGLKLASTGYRFMRYYTRNPAYLRKGAPWLPLRVIAPVVAISTLAVFITGFILLFGGPSTRDPWVQIHKVSFILWVVFTAAHVLGHMPELGRLLGVRGEVFSLPGIRTDLERFEDEASAPGRSTPQAAEARALDGPGAQGRILVLAGAVVVGLVLAMALIPDFHSWVAAQPLFHHDHLHG